MSDEVPKLPRGKGLRLRPADLFRIGMVAVLLLCVLALGQPCADSVAGFVDSFAPPPDAAPEMKLERLTDDEIRSRFPADPDAGAAPPR